MKKRICIKLGSNVLANDNGELNVERISSIVKQLAKAISMGFQPILVSSGAVAVGRARVKMPHKMNSVSARQVWSSVGQVELLNIYSSMFSEYGIVCSQVLVTKQDFRTREHYLNMKNCLTSLLETNIIPIINENDAVSVTALMFTDNDELSGLISEMMNVDSLFLLSNINGIYNGHPDDSSSSVIRTVDADLNKIKKYIQTTKSNFGRGGMLTKCNIASRVAKSGIRVHIANGETEDILISLLNDRDSVDHTMFLPNKRTSSVKKWLECSEGFAKAKVTINMGALDALCSLKATSLLPVGITAFEGDFQKGDIIKIIDESENLIGIGKAQYDKKMAEKYQGKTGVRPLIHYDYLLLY
ncbi:glutamate 5-kinase [Ancylomarina sp. 16SWW S1-10-2]|uniref:glutamate 5-kinase n=1 Tax=Ancylomarina sp. 16SWW S1-10-2 TaxID=2499681 RepID=UPI0034CF4963